MIPRTGPAIPSIEPEAIAARRTRCVAVQVATLRGLREHMVGIIWEHDDMSVREAAHWRGLLTLARSAKQARQFGFDWIERPADLVYAGAALSRFIRIFREGN